MVTIHHKSYASMMSMPRLQMPLDAGPSRAWKGSWKRPSRWRRRLCAWIAASFRHPSAMNQSGLAQVGSGEVAVASQNVGGRRGARGVAADAGEVVGVGELDEPGEVDERIADRPDLPVDQRRSRSDRRTAGCRAGSRRGRSRRRRRRQRGEHRVPQPHERGSSSIRAAAIVSHHSSSSWRGCAPARRRCRSTRGRPRAARRGSRSPPASARRPARPDSSSPSGITGSTASPARRSTAKNGAARDPRSRRRPSAPRRRRRAR